MLHDFWFIVISSPPGSQPECRGTFGVNMCLTNCLRSMFWFTRMDVQICASGTPLNFVSFARASIHFSGAAAHCIARHFSGAAARFTPSPHPAPSHPTPPLHPTHHTPPAIFSHMSMQAVYRPFNRALAMDFPTGGAMAFVPRFKCALAMAAHRPSKKAACSQKQTISGAFVQPPLKTRHIYVRRIAAG